MTALVTHHTVMPEMLPCTLRLPRNSNNPSFKDSEDKEDREEDEDYQKLADFSKMMAHLKMWQPISLGCKYMQIYSWSCLWTV